MPSIQALKGTPDKTRGLFAASAAIAELPAPEHMNDLAQICRAALECMAYQVAEAFHDMEELSGSSGGCRGEAGFHPYFPGSPSGEAEFAHVPGHQYSLQNHAGFSGQPFLSPGDSHLLRG